MLGVTLLAIARAHAGDDPVPHPAPLPTAAVDESRFPRSAPDRPAVGTRAFVVATTGSDRAAGTEAEPFRTILRGLEAAREAGGAAVVVRAGTYAEGSTDSERALVIDRDGTSLWAAPGEAVAVQPAGSGVTYGLAIEASHVIVRGLSLSGFASNGIAVGREGAAIQDVVIANVEVAMPAGGDGIAVFVGGSNERPAIDGLRLERIKVSGADLGVTVSTGPIRNLVITDIAIRGRGGQGENSGADAIAVESGDNVLINGADIALADGDGIDLKATRVAVINVHVHDCGRNAIKLWRGGDIVNALVHDCGADAAIVLDGTNPDAAHPAEYRIVASTIAFHNRRNGAAKSYVLTCGYDRPGDTNRLALIACVFHGNTGGMVLSRGTRFAVRACLLGAIEGGLAFEHGWDGAASHVAGSLDELGRAGESVANLAPATAPGLTDPAATTVNGFRPAGSSALAGRGVRSRGLPTVDLTGAMRPAAPSIGALEPVR